MRRRFFIALLAGSALACAAPMAHATWRGPFKLDEGGVAGNWWPEVALETNGAGVALAAWTGPNVHARPQAERYVHAVYRQPRLAFGPIHPVAEQSHLVDAALNERGHGVLLVDHGSYRGPYDESLVFAHPAGAGFTRPESISRSFDALYSEPQAVEIDDAGNVLIIKTDPDPEREGFSETWRTSSGRYTKPRVHAADMHQFGPLSLTTDPSGRMTLLFNVMAENGHDPSRVYESVGNAQAGLGAPVPVTDWQQTDPYSGSWPKVATNARGDIAVLANGKVRVKPAGGSWSATEDVQGPEPEATIYGGSADIAIDQEGNVFTAWAARFTLGRYRPAGGRFGPVEFVNREPLGVVQTPDIWFDQAGNLLYAYRTDDGSLHMRARPPDGSAGPPYLLAPPGQPPTVSATGPIEDGWDVLLWSRGVRSLGGFAKLDPTLRLSLRKPDPPQRAPVVRRVAARAPGLAVTVSEKGVAEVILERYREGRLTGRRIARFARPIVRGRNELRFSKRLRRKLRAAGRVRAVIAATDRKGKRSRERQVVFRVP